MIFSGGHALVKLLFLVILTILASAVAPDNNENCQGWAEMGECEKNPGYMMPNCATSCDRVAQQALKDSKELSSIGSFFDLSANDIHGKTISFSEFQGQVTVLVNVASYCGFTDSHYRGLVQLYSSLEHVHSQINILAFPCNQFGAQEPGSNDSIENFALGYGVEFTMMEKIDVNGPNASIVFKYLKANAKGGPNNISWNFATYFVVSPDGSMTAHSGIEPMQLKENVLELLESDEL